MNIKCLKLLYLYPATKKTSENFSKFFEIKSKIVKF